MISGIEGGGFMGLTQMSAMRPPMGDPFEKNDSNGDGSLDKTELSSFAGEISEMTGQSVDVDELLSKLDGDEDGLVSREEFEAGRPEGPPPGMMETIGGIEQGGNIQALLDMLNGSEDEEDEDESSDFLNSLDTNGDGTVDAEEAEAGINYLVQKYQEQLTNALSQSGRLFDFQG